MKLDNSWKANICLLLALCHNMLGYFDFDACDGAADAFFQQQAKMSIFQKV